MYKFTAFIRGESGKRVVGQFEISLSKDCQVCHIELVEILSKPCSETRSPSTTFRQAQYRLTSKEFQTDPLPNFQKSKIAPGLFGFNVKHQTLNVKHPWLKVFSEGSPRNSSSSSMLSWRCCSCLVAMGIGSILNISGSLGFLRSLHFIFFAHCSSSWSFGC